MVEQLFCKQQVRGSSPLSGSRQTRGFFLLLLMAACYVLVKEGALYLGPAGGDPIGRFSVDCAPGGQAMTSFPTGRRVTGFFDRRPCVPLSHHPRL